ncbi:GNAT family N-acetyltransferase [Agromyces sp. H66]|uniref:GNAT family N-acetyltransferase n=1 Tax=Agromyces sp. H66 TaxID=2529859 RepID=UPI0010AB30E0|nr:GNAT family N-acetyltransferase [Agromyces sp. H66]
MPVTLRPATSEDRDAIVAVFLDCWRESYVGVLPSAAIEAMTDARAQALWRRVLASTEGTVLVAERDGVVLGVTRFAASPEGDDGAVHSLYVSPRARGLGLGTMLLDRAYETLRAGGARSVALWVFEANAPSIAFYRGRGWLPDGGSRTQDEFGEPELRLRRGGEEPA